MTGATLAHKIIGSLERNSWPNWAEYKVSIDTGRGETHSFFAHKESASMYVKLVQSDAIICAIWAEKWDWGPQPISLNELKS